MEAINNGLICAYLLDGEGGGRPMNWDEINHWRPEQGLLWMHLDYTAPNTREWLEQHSNLEPLNVSNLLAEQTAPRCFLTNTGALLNLRGVNFSVHKNNDDMDMVSMRIWLEKNRIISVQHYHLLAIDEVIKNIHQGVGPRTTSEFIVDIVTEILDSMNVVINALEKKINDLQDSINNEEPHKTRSRLSLCRRRIITMRRYIFPQRDALLRLQTDKILWLNDSDRMHIREVTDRTTRYIEDLDATRDRATIVQEELINHTSELIDRKIYVLSIIAVIFLPLSFLVGLLGINVGGVPGLHSHWGFGIVCGITASLLLVELVVLKRLKWI